MRTNSLPNHALEFALAYLELAWSVIPIDYHAGMEKMPLIQWKAYQDEHPTAEKVAEWWEQHPSANLAVVTGRISDLIVIDIDSGTGQEAFIAQFGELHGTVRQQTGKPGGLHLFFRHPGDRTYKNATRILPDVDVRADGGYVIVPPSIHSSGREYQWIIDPREGGLDDLLDLPPEIADFLTGDAENTGAEEQQQPPTCGRSRIAELMLGVSEGKRNAAAATVCGHLLHQYHGDLGLVEKLMADWNSRNLPPLIEDELQRVIKSITQRHVSDSRNPGRFFHKGTFIPLTMAKLLNEKGNIIFYGDTFYEYEEGVYKRLDSTSLTRQVTSVLGEKVKPSYRKATLEILSDITYRKITEDTLQDPYFLNVKNGLLDLRTLQLRQHTSSFISFAQLPVTYDREAKAPRWEQFLQQVLRKDPSQIETLKQFTGYALCHRLFIHKVLVLLGQGANGKSVFVNTLAALFGKDNVSALDMHALGEGFLLAGLQHKLLNIAAEVNVERTIASARFKQVTAGDLVTADVKFRDAIQFRPIAKHVFCLNKAPRINDYTFAMVRRLIIVEFSERFVGSRADPDLEEKLVGESPGILNWAIQGLQEVFKRKEIFISETSHESLSHFMRQGNAIDAFVSECCSLQPDGTVGKETLYKRYVDWAEGNGVAPQSRKVFWKTMMQAHPDLQEIRPGGGGRAIQGLALN